MVCCDKCESWYHPGCIGMSLQVHQDLVDGDHEWFCHKCEDTADGAAAETAAADGAAKGKHLTRGTRPLLFVENMST